VTGRLITVYSRDGCHLCQRAIEELEPLVAAPGIRLEIVDIEADPRLHAAYLERIPVVALDGEELYEFFVDVGDLGARLAGGSPGDVGARRSGKSHEAGR
jgi:hypothetical protein